MYRAIVLTAAGLIACRSDRAPTGSAGSGGGAPPALVVAPAEGPSLPFPHRPPQCSYEVISVSPGAPRINPNAPVYGLAPRVRNLHITFVGDPSNSVVIQWSTDAATLASEVHFGDAGRPLDRVAQGYSFTYLGPGAAGRRQHEVHLCGLEPGRRYVYTVGVPGSGRPAARGTAGPYSFVTAPAGPGEVQILVAGDSRTDPATWRTVAAHAMAEHPDMLLFTGDAVADGASQPLWDAFFEASPELFATTPGLWADGNHEGISEVYYAQFALPANGDPQHHEHWYTAQYGPVTAIALNDTTVPAEVVSGKEARWLRTALAAVDRVRTPYVVTLHHQPIYTTAVGHLPDEVTRRAWAPLFDEFHVNADFSGHVHNYESTLPLRAGQVVPAAQGTRYFIYGGGGAPLYPFRPDEPWVQHRESVHGYAMLAAGAGRLRWDAHRVDGSLIESIDLLH